MGGCGLRVLHQKVVLDISQADMSLSGWCALNVCARDSAECIRLNAGMMTIDAVRVNGTDALFTHSAVVSDGVGAGGESHESGVGHPVQGFLRGARHDNDELIIEWPVVTGEQLVVEVAFKVDSSSPSCLFFKSPDSSSTSQVIVQCELEQARHWIPCVDRLTARCKWDLELSIDVQERSTMDQLFVIGSGALVQQIFDETRGRKVFSYKLDVPVPPSKVGFIAGQFKMHKMHGIPNAHLFTPLRTSNSASKSKLDGDGEEDGGGALGEENSKVVPVIDFLTRAFGYLNWLLNTRYPWAGFYLVFVRDAPRILTALPNLVLLPTALLHPLTVLDQTWETRRVLCAALIEQYYFCKTVPSIADRWIVPALSRYLSLHQLRVFHGNNDYRLQLRKDLERVLELEERSESIKGRALYDERRRMFELEQSFCINNEPYEWMSLKGRLVLVMLEQSLGKQNIQKILMQMFIDSNTIDGSIEDIFSISYLQRTIKRITGKDMRGFLEMWLLAPGFPIFDISFAYNRKKSCIEVDVRQAHSLSVDSMAVSAVKRRSAKFTGSLLIRVYETDSAYDHVVHIDDAQHHFELPFHTKIRKPRQSSKRQQQEAVGSQPSEENNDEDAMASASASSSAALQNKVTPVSWVRIDPEQEWIARINLSQPDVMWIEQLENDRDVIAQYDAINALSRFPSDAACVSLEKSVADFKAFHKIRSSGLVAMAACSVHTLQFANARKLIDMFARRFGLRDNASGEVLPRTNNFENLSNYCLLLSVPEALSRLRDGEGRCPEPAVQLLLNLLKYNDNSSNGYSDYFYLSIIVECLSKALSAGGCPNRALLADCLKELDRYAFLDRILPSHRNTVMCAVLNGMVTLQEAQLCSFSIDTFLPYMEYGNYLEVRIAAARSILRLFSATDLIFESLQNDPSKSFKRALGILLIQDPKLLTFDTARLSDRLYEVMKSGSLLATTIDQLRHLVERMYPEEMDDKVSEITAPLLTLTLPSTPVKSKAAEPSEQASWLAEISEGMPPIVIGASRRDTSDFAADVHVEASIKAVPKAPKLRLAISTARSLADQCTAVLNALWDHPDSYPFRYPVDTSVPHYYDIIKSPMDLSSLRSKLSSFSMSADFIRSLRLIFDNCFQFNHPHSLIYAQAKELRKQAIKETKKAFPELKGTIKDLISADIPIQSLDALDISRNISHADVENDADDEFDVCKRLLNRLSQLPQSFWFLHPVDPITLGIPTYFEIVKEPMDFGTMRGKLDAGSYAVKEEFLRDLKLVFTNCYAFNNPSDPVCNDAKVLERIVADAFPEYSNIEVTSLGKIPPSSEPTSVEKEQKPVLRLKLGSKAERAGEKLLMGEHFRRILDTLCSDSQSGPFLHPVVGVPGYLKAIRKPMDLSTIRRKLDQHLYVSPDVFKADLDQIWHNCAKFNGPDAPITGMSQHLSDLADNLFNEFGLS